MNRYQNSSNSCNIEKKQKIEKSKYCDNKYNDKCECGFENDPTIFPENYMYGQSYVPIQYINEIFKPEVGLKMGTIFPELVSPYMPEQSMEEDNYLRRMTSLEGQCPLRQ